MGYALAAAAVARGWSVDLVSGPVALEAPVGVALHRVVSAAELFAACDARFAACDLFIAVAAVADYRPKNVHPQKQKKNPGPVVLELVPTIDGLKTLAAKKSAGQTVVGFAAETHDVETYARKKLLEKLGASVIEGAAIVDLPELGGSQRIKDSGLKLFTLVSFEGH